MTTKEEQLQQLRILTIDLCQNHNVSHETIKHEVYKALAELSSKLPKIPVLYNGIHGGFGYDRKFIEYCYPEINEKDCKYMTLGSNCKEERIFNVDKVREYGHYCISKYPFIVKLIALYNKYKLKEVFDNLSSIEYKNKCNEDIKSIVSQIKDTDASLFGNEQATQSSYICKDKNKFDINKVTKYSKASLLNYYSKSIDNNVSKIVELETYNKTCIPDLDTYTFLTQKYKVTFDDDKVSNSWLHTAWNVKLIPGKGNTRLTFMDAIEEYGETHHGIWECQSHYSVQPMRFLNKHHNVFKAVSELESTEELGLVFASSRHCRLCIGYAPQVLSWYIGEYDGLEAIVVA